MLLKFLATLLFFGPIAHAKTLSEVVLIEQLRENKNYVFSNTSIDGLLSLISFGLTEPLQNELVSYWNGTSLVNQAKKMASLNESSPSVSVLVDYNIWVDQNYSLLPSYIEGVSKNFSIVPSTMDVMNKGEVVDSVNSWAAGVTNNLITKVIDQNFVTPDLITILANAVYFKGEWKNKFDEAYTEPKDFYGAGLVDTMASGESYNFAYNERDKVVTVELPFLGEKYTMVIAMAAKLKGVEIEEPEFSYKSGKNIKKIFKDYIVNSKATKELAESEYDGDLYLYLPKFTIESEIQNIEKKLSAIGLSNLLKSGALANMSNDDIQISKILQKAKIIVNEEGAEAAAVSVGGAVIVSASTPIIMKINGPFVYMIRNNISNEKLFEGVVLNPAQ